MTGVVAALVGAKAKIAPITVSANWGGDVLAYPAVMTSAARTLTVPAGNPGSLKLTPNVPSGTMKYRLNAGSFTTISVTTTITVANGDALTFQYSPGGAPDTGNIAAGDNTTGDSVGTYSAVSI